MAGQTQNGGSDDNSQPEEEVVQVSAGDIVALSNQARRDNGQSDLRNDTALNQAAALRARELARNFSHTRPDGSSCFTVVTGNYKKLGENIAYIQGEATAEDFVKNWMASQNHRANLLDADFDLLAVGVYYDADRNITYAVQLFAAEYTFTTTVVAPTCTEQGYTQHDCVEDAAQSYRDTYVPALGHAWDDGEVTKEPTCTEEGEKLLTCTRCQETTTQTIPALGHKTEVRNAKEATCTEDGYTGDTVCTVCGETIETGTVIKATGHKTEVQNAKKATCTETGYTGDTVCTVCGETLEKGGEIAALGHDFQGDTIDTTCRRCNTRLFVFSKTVEPTCQEMGYDLYVSILDPNQIRKTNFTDTVDHNYVDGACTMCGEEEPENPSIPSYDDNYSEEYYNNYIIGATNEERTKKGLPEYRYASEYQAAADIRAEELIQGFSHTRPDGSAPSTALDELGAHYSNVGENIAWVSSMYKPSKIMEEWMASSGHASNILSSAFDSFVVGTACSNGKIYAVQIFFKDTSAAGRSEVTRQMMAPALTAAQALAQVAGTDEAQAAPEDQPTAPATPAPTEAPVETPAPAATPAPTEAPAENPAPTEIPAEEADTLAEEPAPEVPVAETPTE